jgi:hypothetical protein
MLTFLKVDRNGNGETPKREEKAWSYELILD